jgi:hypothetical protein
VIGAILDRESKLDRLPRTMPWLPGVVLSVVLKATVFSAYYPVADEAAYAAIARSWTQTYRPYGRHFIDRPPLLLLVMRLFGAPGRTRIGFTLLSLLCLSTMVIAATVIAKRVALGPRAVCAVGIIVAAFGAHPRIVGAYVPNELLEAAASAVAIALLLRRAEPSNRVTFAVGVALGVSQSFKQSALGVLLAVTGILLVQTSRTWKLRITHVAFLVGGVGLVLAPQIAFVGFRNYWWTMYGARAKYMSIRTQSGGQLLDIGIRTVKAFGVSLGFLLAGAVLGVLLGQRSRNRSLLVAWWFGSLALIITGGNFWPSNWIGIFVPSTVLLVSAVQSIARRTSEGRSTRIPRLGATAATLVGVLFSVDAVGAIATSLRPLPNYRVDGVTYKSAQWAAAAYVRNRTTSDEVVGSLYQLNGFDLQVQRPLVQRHFFLDMLSRYSGAPDELVSLIELDKPRFLATDDAALVPLHCTSTCVLDLLHSEYRLQTHFGDVKVYVRK